MVVPAAFAQRSFFLDLHFHIIVGVILILCIDIQTDALVLRMINNALFPAHHYMGNGKAQHHLQKSSAVLLHAHHCAKEKVILDCQIL